MPRATSRVMATKASELRVLATRAKTRRSTRDPMARTPPSAPSSTNAVLPSSSKPATVPVPYSCDSMTGMRASSGTTARSCSSRMPREAAPVRAFCKFFSCSTLSTNALELRLSADPMMSASSGLVMLTSAGREWKTTSSSSTPPVNGNTPKAMVHRITCSRPRPKANLARLRNRSSVSSRPCSKSRKRMPISPSTSRSCKSRKMPKPLGPNTKPMARKPSTLLMRRYFVSGITSTVVARNTRPSFPRILSPSTARRGGSRCELRALGRGARRKPFAEGDGRSEGGAGRSESGGALA
mmetsp:Transcript_44907/g.140675  ORF Transcript_44907/g.140675 Transcript_44907/m.140675 type:complete len:297 (-) Transcript_44907:332-1222(-)